MKIPKNWRRDDWTDVAQFPSDHGDVWLKRDKAGNYHLIGFQTLWNGEPLPAGDLCSPLEILAEKGLDFSEVTRTPVRLIRDLSKEEAAIWCVKNLIPEEFHARFLEFT